MSWYCPYCLDDGRNQYGLWPGFPLSAASIRANFHASIAVSLLLLLTENVQFDYFITILLDIASFLLDTDTSSCKSTRCVKLPVL